MPGLAPARPARLGESLCLRSRRSAPPVFCWNPSRPPGRRARGRVRRSAGLSAGWGGARVPSSRRRAPRRTRPPRFRAGKDPPIMDESTATAPISSRCEGLIRSSPDVRRWRSAPRPRALMQRRSPSHPQGQARMAGSRLAISPLMGNVNRVDEAPRPPPRSSTHRERVIPFAALERWLARGLPRGEPRVPVAPFRAPRRQPAAIAMRPRRFRSARRAPCRPRCATRLGLLRLNPTDRPLRERAGELSIRACASREMAASGARSWPHRNIVLLPRSCAGRARLPKARCKAYQTEGDRRIISTPRARRFLAQCRSHALLAECSRRHHAAQAAETLTRPSLRSTPRRLTASCIRSHGVRLVPLGNLSDRFYASCARPQEL